MTSLIFWLEFFLVSTALSGGVEYTDCIFVEG